MSKIGFYLNDVIPAITPRPVYLHALRMGYETSHWADRANSFVRREGRQYGEGFLLLRWGDIKDVPIDGQVSLTIKQETSEGETGSASQITFGKLHIQSIKTIYSTGALTDDTLCIVHLVDARYLYEMTSVNKSYNVPSPAPTSLDPTNPGFYDTESLNSGALWTWQEMITDLWSTLPSGYAGTAPTLPYSPDGKPFDFAFRGEPGWHALWLAFDLLRVGLTLSPSTSAATLFQRGEAQSEFSSALETNKAFGMGRNLAKASAATQVPAEIKVLFTKTHIGPGVAKEISRTGNYLQNMVHSQTVASGVAGAVAGTVMVVHDDLQAVVSADGTIINSSAVSSRAAEKAAKVVSSLQKKIPTRSAFAGYRSDFVPGSEVKQVSYSDLASTTGLITELVQKSANDTDAETLVSTIGGGGHGILGGGGLPEPGFIGRNIKAPSGKKQEGTHTANQGVYPHHTHMVMIWEASGSLGDPIARNSDGFYPGVILQVDPDADFATDEPYLSGDPCYIVASNLYVGSGNPNAKICKGEIYPAKINGSANSGGTTRPLFILHRAQNEIWHVTAGGAIAAGGSGAVSLPDGRTVSATNWSSDVPITPGMKITVFLDQYTNQYFAIAGKVSNAEIFAGVVGSPTIAPNVVGYIITNGGGTINARNWSNSRVVYGDKVIAWKDSANDQYYFLKGGSGGTRWFKALLNGDTNPEAETVSIALVKPLDGGPPPSPVPTEIQNPHSLQGNGAKEVTFCEDMSGESLAYRLIQVDHVEVDVMTAFRYAADEKNIQGKFRHIWAPVVEEESDWVLLQLLEEMDIVTSVTIDTLDVNYTTEKVVVFARDDAPQTELVFSFTEIQYTESVQMDGGALKGTARAAFAYDPGEPSDYLIFEPEVVEVVVSVSDEGATLNYQTITIGVWAEGAGNDVDWTNVDDCD
jgi:hypothetical protein